MATDLTGRELFQVYGSSELVTAAQIAALSVGASGGYSSQAFVSTGLTGPLAALSSFMGWESASIGTKTQPIPASTGSLKLITVMDLLGTASLSAPINISPVSGSIIGPSSIYTPYGSLDLLDTLAGWVSK